MGTLMTSSCDGKKIVPVPGFGFFNECTRDKMNNELEVTMITLVNVAESLV